MAEDIKKKENEIGHRAAKMAQDYVHRVLRERLTIQGKGGLKMKPILEATKVMAVMGDHRLLGLNFTSTQVGFIQHYGFTGVRQGGEVFLKAARYHQGKTTRDAHHVDLPEKLLFQDMYQNSGALDYLLQELGKTRTDALKIQLQQLVLNLDPSNGEKK